MIRTLFTIVPLLFYAFTQVMAQHTFDVKFNGFNEDLGDLTGLYRYTKEKVLVYGNTNDLEATFMAIDNNGAFVKNCKLGFKQGWTAITWYNEEDNLLYAFMDESLGKKPGFPWHLVVLDTNLNVKSDTRLDSTIMDISPNLSLLVDPTYIRLKDTSFILMVRYFEYTGAQNGKGESRAYHILKNGHISKVHKFDSYNTFDEPLYQKNNGNIVWRFSSNDVSYYYDSFYESDTSFKINRELLKFGLPFFYTNNSYCRNFIPTKDNGFALLGADDTLYTSVELIKYDSNYTKQWTTIVPGYDIETLQLIENLNGGYFVITQSVTDTSKSWLYSCLQDLAVSKVSAEGKYQFTAYYGSGTCVQVVKNAIQDSDGGIMITGRYNSLNALICNNICSTPRFEWLFKIDTLGGGARLLTSVMEQSDELNETILYPNPTSDILYVNTEFSSIDIFNSNGESAYQYSATELRGSTSIDISHLFSGIYFCRITRKDGTIVKPFIVQH